MENTAGKIFTELKEDISTYARLKLRLLKLMAIERTAIVLAVLSHSLILLLLSFFTVLFLFVALGCYLGELLDSPALRFSDCRRFLPIVHFDSLGNETWNPDRDNEYGYRSFASE